MQKIQTYEKLILNKVIFQGYSSSLLLFIVALITLSLILRKVKAAYEFSGRKDKINHLLFMGDLKLHCCNEKD